MSEKELCKALIQYLKDFPYEIYQEVSHMYGRADIVAKSGQILLGIEAKTTLSMAVLEQAIRSRELFHYAYIYVPRSRNTGRGLAERICKQYGIGIFTCYQQGTTFIVKEELKARLNRKALTKYVPLHEQQKDFSEAGNNTGRYWSPFKDTCRQLINLVTSQPGLCMPYGDALKKIDHHYSSLGSAKSSLKLWIGIGELQRLSLENGILIYNK